MERASCERPEAQRKRTVLERQASLTSNVLLMEFGLEVADSIIEKANLASGGAYTSVGTYSHKEIIDLVVQLAETTKAVTVCDNECLQPHDGTCDGGSRL